MIENKNSQEKLLAMLSEIYSQLEELEEVLEHSLTDLRGNLYQEQSDTLNKMEMGMAEMEQSIHSDSLTNKNVVEVEFSKKHKKSLTLELGF
jgi:hypothetical protein